MSDDLYQYPADHIGRKSYVGVRGHSRSVPKFKTYRGTDGYNYVLPEFGGSWDGAQASAAPMVMRDIGEYVSPIDNQVITSRSHHRNHMRVHNVIEVGNERVGRRSEAAPMSRAGADIARAMREVQGR